MSPRLRLEYSGTIHHLFLGDTANDKVIAKVASSIRYAPVWRVELSGLVPESTYKLQLLFFEQCCGGRGFSVSVDGVLIAEAFIPADIQEGVNTGNGSVTVTPAGTLKFYRAVRK